MSRSKTERRVPLDTLRIRGLRVDCVVGVYPSERTQPQPLIVDLSLRVDARAAGRGGGLAASVDYARLAGEIRFLLGAGRFYLLESAAEALCSYVLAPPLVDLPRAHVESVKLRLTKPRALAGGALPSITVRRHVSEYRYEVEESSFGKVDVIYEGSGCGIYRLRIAPGGTIPTHLHREMDESEMVLSGNLLLQGERVAPGSVFHWPRNHPHRWDNPEGYEQTVLCVDRPAFLRRDEIEVEEPEGGLVLPQAVSLYPKEVEEERG